MLIEDIHPLSRIIWGEYRFRISGVEGKTLNLLCSDGTKTRRELTIEQLSAHVAIKEIVLESAYFARDGRAATAHDPVTILAWQDAAQADFFSKLPLKYQLAALDNLEWVEALDEDYRNGKVVLYASKGEMVRPNGKVPLDVWIAANTSKIRERCRSWHLMRSSGKLDAALPKKRRKGQPTGDVEPPKVSQLKANYKIFKSEAFHISHLAPKYANCVHGGKRLSRETVEISEKILQENYASSERMGLGGVIALISATLTSKAGKEVKGPSREALRAILDKMSDGRVIAAQLGFKRAREQRGTNSKGPRPHRMGEHVLMDCWMVDMIVLLKQTGAWINLSRAEKKSWGLRSRVWICVAIDVATRMVLGIAFGLAESPELSRRVLRMVVSDKTDIADGFECQAMPPPALTPDSLFTDSGVAFTHPFFKIPALTLIRRITVGIVGKPWRRAILERLFGGTKDQFLPYFSGLTFGNPLVKGDFDSEAHASATLELFGKQCFRYYNDVYHLREHSGLNEQPPINKAIEVIEAMGFKDPPTTERKRVSLGLEMSIPLTCEGITYCGIEYKTAWLANVFFDGGPINLRVKVDQCDLGCISVLWSDEWETVPGPFEFNGIGLTAWQTTTRALKRRHGDQASVNFPIVAKALLEFRASGKKARADAGLADWNYNSDAVRQAVESCAIRVLYRPSPLGPLPPRTITNGAFGVGYIATGPNNFQREDETIEPDWSGGNDDKGDEFNNLYSSELMGPSEGSDDFNLINSNNIRKEPVFTSLSEMKNQRSERGNLK